MREAMDGTNEKIADFLFGSLGQLIRGKEDCLVLCGADTNGAVAAYLLERLFAELRPGVKRIYRAVQQSDIDLEWLPPLIQNHPHMLVLLLDPPFPLTAEAQSTLANVEGMVIGSRVKKISESMINGGQALATAPGHWPEALDSHPASIELALLTRASGLSLSDLEKLYVGAGAVSANEYRYSSLHTSSITILGGAQQPPPVEQVKILADGIDIHLGRYGRPDLERALRSLQSASATIRLDEGLRLIHSTLELTAARQAREEDITKGLDYVEVRVGDGALVCATLPVESDCVDSVARIAASRYPNHLFVLSSPTASHASIVVRKKGKEAGYFLALLNRQTHFYTPSVAGILEKSAWAIVPSNEIAMFCDSLASAYRQI
ncbi:hypothetical protein [Micromonospora sp. NPDC001898]|uniref:hypothetical protein n=1 Tax=Micromonospora sp. NPDC001898 TaxID=3364221 RepID=UPI0036AF1271